MQQLKIGIIGDFNFSFNTHHATNLALDHAGLFLEVELSYYWIKINEILSMKSTQLSNYDGFWLAPGPFLNQFFLNGVVDQLMQQGVPVFITGEGFKSLLDVLVQRNNLNAQGEKLVSDNLVDGNQFEYISVVPHSTELLHLYETRNKQELTASRYSMYPKLIETLISNEIDVEAYNQFEEPEVISLKNRDFFVACGFVRKLVPHAIYRIRWFTPF